MLVQLNLINQPAVRFAFYGWGNPPLPATCDDIKEYMATLKAVEPAPQWVFDTLDLLLEDKDNMEIHTGARPRMLYLLSRGPITDVH